MVPQRPRNGGVRHRGRVAARHRKAGLLALTLAVVVSVARVAVGTHYPGDVLGGAAVGTVAALVVWHPSVRGPLHGLAEWAGWCYERLTARLVTPSGAG